MNGKQLDDVDKIKTVVVVCIISFILMIIVQIPTPGVLNPVGCLFAGAWMLSGMFAAIGVLFHWE